MAAHNTGNFQALLFPGLRKIWGTKHKEWDKEYDKYLQVQKSDQYFEDDLQMQGFALVPEVGEGAPLPMGEMLQGYTKRYTHVEYRLGFSVSKALFEDNRYKPMVKMTEALAKSYRLTVEHTSANLINNGHSATNVCYDGQALFSTAHLNPDQSTYSNRITTAADLTMTSFEQALIDIGRFKGTDGLEMAMRGKLLMVPPELEFVATQILKSAGHPETPNHSINPVFGRMPFMVCHYLTDVDQWQIITDADNGLQFFERVAPEFGTENMFSTEDAQFKVRGRFSVGVTDPRGVYGSPGA